MPLLLTTRLVLAGHRAQPCFPLETFSSLFPTGKTKIPAGSLGSTPRLPMALPALQGPGPDSQATSQTQDEHSMHRVQRKDWARSLLLLTQEDSRLRRSWAWAGFLTM